MKRNAIFLYILMLAVAFAMTGCGSSRVQLVEGKVNVVATFYPLYDFAAQIGGTHANVINLVPAGVEPHHWQPKSRDMKAMTNAQLFLYNGAGFEGWVHDFLDSLKSDSKLVVVEASRGIEMLKGDLEDEHADENEKDGHDDNGKDGQDHEHESEHDPHVWLSPLQAIKMAENVKNGFVQADPAHQADYEANFKKLEGKLLALHNKFKESLGKASKKEIVVSHDAFGYLCREYGLTQMPIMGLSPDSEPTSRQLKEINEFVRTHNVKYIFFEELVSDKLAKTLANDAGIETLVLNPLEGLTEEQLRAGDNYVTVMERNLQNLLKALQ